MARKRIITISIAVGVLISLAILSLAYLPKYRADLPTEISPTITTTSLFNRRIGSLQTQVHVIDLPKETQEFKLTTR
jgi:hypothetical protein